MKTITRTEEMMMLSILNLGDEAYLVAIKDYLESLTGKSISMTSVHLPLSRLEKIGYLDSEMGEATAVRGGRRKKIYSVTKAGFAALEDYKAMSDKLWRDYLNPETK